MSDMASTILLIDESPVRTSADLSSWIDGDCVKAASKQRNNPTAPSSITETLDEERNGLESILAQQTVAEFNDSMETPIESGASTAIDEHHKMVPFTRSPVATRLLYDTIYNTLENWNNFKKPISHSKSDLSSVSWGKNDAMGTLAAQSHLSSHTEPKRTIPKSNLSRKLKSPEFNQEDSSNLLIPEEVIAKASNDPLLRPCVSRFGSDFVGRHLNLVSGRDDEWQEKLECSIHPFPELSERGNCDSFGESDIASFPVRDHGAPTLYNGDNHPLVRRFKNAYIKDTDFDFHSDPTSATGQMMPQKSAGGPYHQSPPSPFLKTNIMLSKSASAPTVREENVSKSTTVEKSDLTALTWLFKTLLVQMAPEEFTKGQEMQAKDLFQSITEWSTHPPDLATFMECTECHKLVCPDCIGICPVDLCHNRLCRVCRPNSKGEANWDPCIWHEMI
ncbi:MAG: hypothetical protein Q9190_006379 [Brigantiaea leucoxantha]